METENTEKAKKAHGIIVRVLKKCGVPEKAAAIIGGAVIGAAAAAVAIYYTGCTVDFTQTADGSSTFHGTLVPLEASEK